MGPWTPTRDDLQVAVQVAEAGVFVAQRNLADTLRVMLDARETYNELAPMHPDARQVHRDSLTDAESAHDWAVKAADDAARALAEAHSALDRHDTDDVVDAQLLDPDREAELVAAEDEGAAMWAPPTDKAAALAEVDEAMTAARDHLANLEVRRENLLQMDLVEVAEGLDAGHIIAWSEHPTDQPNSYPRTAVMNPHGFWELNGVHGTLSTHELNDRLNSAFHRVTNVKGIPA